MEQIEILDVAAEGKAITRWKDKVIFVPFTAPGDIVDLQIFRQKKSFAEGRVMKYHKYSDLRTEPFCEHFSICGGCKWQHLPYSEQLKFKQKQVFDNLSRIGKIDLPEFDPIKGSEKTEFYRNKLEFTFSNKRWLTFEEINSDFEHKDMNALGFHIPGCFDKVLDIKKCWLQDNISNEIRLAIREYALKHDLEFFDLRNQAGFLRTMIVRTSSTGEIMLIISFYKEDKEAREGLLNFVAEKLPQITSLMYVINGKCNDTITDQDIIAFKGNDHIFEQMEDLKFKIGPKSFYQTNSEQAYELYSITREFAGLSGSELVYDLYTGTGTIANFVAKQASKVVGIEYVPEAIEDAKVNSNINKLENTQIGRAHV